MHSSTERRKPSKTLDKPSKTLDQEVLKISDIPKTYPKQWVSVDITQRDKYGMPAAGKVIFQSKNRDDMVDKIKNTQGDLYIFYSGSIDDDDVN